MIKYSVCPCCLKANFGVRQNAKTLGCMFKDLFSEKLNNKQLNILINICYKCYAKLKVAYSYGRLFREFLNRFEKGGERFYDGEVKVDLADMPDIPVALRCPICMIGQPTVQHVYTHLYDDQGCNSCDGCLPHIQQHSFLSTKCTQYTSKNCSTTFVYNCVGACGASFIRRGLLDSHYLECKHVPSVSVECEPFSKISFNEASEIADDLGDLSDDQTQEFSIGSLEFTLQSSESKKSITDMETSHLDLDHTTNISKRTNSRLRLCKNLAVKNATGRRKNIGKARRCRICSEWHVNLYQHILTHGPADFFKCKHCKEPFKNDSLLSRHEKHECIMRPPQEPVREFAPSMIPHVCDICGKSFENRMRLNGHQNAVHLRVPCPICGKMMGKTNILVHTQTVHDKQAVICEFCGILIKNRALMFQHLKRKHSDNPHIYECTKCSYKSASKPNFRTHERSHNIGTKEFNCDKCNSSFFHEQSLKNHRKIVHEKLTSHTCTICGLTVKSMSSLKVHARRHTGDKPYFCDICKKTFSQKPSLNRHLRSVHRVGPPLVEPCPECGKMFSTLGVLKIHIIKAH